MKYAPREAVEAAIEEWSDAVIKCRLFGHAHTRGHSAVRRPGGLWVTVKCERKCGVLKEFFMDRRGYVDQRPAKLVYPKEGYLLKGLGRVDRNGMAAIRLAVLANMRIIEET